MPRRGAGSADSGRSAPSLSALAYVVGLGLGSGACGGGLPLLHPAQVLAAGEVRAAAGVSATVATGALSSAIADARPGAGNGPPAVAPTGIDPRYARGAIALAAAGPGIAPVAAARVGLGNALEAGLAYTGRAVRADVRRAFGLAENWAFSVGVGGSAALTGGGQGTGAGGDASWPDLDLARLHGWGADVPVLVGYESSGDLYMLWLGARAGWEHVDVGDVGGAPGSGGVPIGPPVALSATSFSGGGLVGLAAGFRHVHVAMELDVSYASVTGDYGATQPQHVRLSGLTLAPASALWWRF